MCEKAVCSVFADEAEACFVKKHNIRDGQTRADNFGLWRATVNKLMYNPSLLPKLTQLQGSYTGLGQQIIEHEGQPVIDAFQIHDILAKNQMFCVTPFEEFGSKDLGFCIKGEQDPGVSGGIFPHASFVCHSCIANCHKACLGDFLVVRATRPIAAGEELTWPYRSPLEDDQKHNLRVEWGIECRCVLCCAESWDSDEILRRRKILVRASRVFATKYASKALGKDGVVASDEDIDNAVDFLRRIDETYDNEEYRGCYIPRVGRTSLALWLVQATYRRGDFDATLKAARDHFLAMGYCKVHFGAHDIDLLSTPNTALAIESMRILQIVAQVQLERGHEDVGTALEKIAQVLYRIMNGTMSGYMNGEQEVFPDLL